MVLMNISKSYILIPAQKLDDYLQKQDVFFNKLKCTVHNAMCNVDILGRCPADCSEKFEMLFSFLNTNTSINNLKRISTTRSLDSS